MSSALQPGDKVRLRDYPSWGTGIVREREKDPPMSGRYIVDWPEHGGMTTIDPWHKLLTEGYWLP